MVIDKQCAWCGVPMGTVGEDDGSGGARPVSHGICLPCLADMTKESLQEFLDHLGVPVVAVDGDVVALGASKEACEVLGKDVSELRGKRSGDMIGCVESFKPGGCGAQEICRSCAIRGTVGETYRTGRPSAHVISEKHVMAGGAPSEMRVAISTEKTGDVVLLRIDEAELCPTS